jgi:hypothetical protein
MTRLNWQDRADHRLDGRRRSRGPTARASWRRSCSRLISLATSMAPASLSTPCTPRPIWTRPCAPGRHHALEQRRGRRPGDPQSRRLACARSAERPLLQLTGGSARGRTGVWRRGAPPPQCDQPRADQPFLYSHGFCRIGEVTPPADPAPHQSLVFPAPHANGSSERCTVDSLAVAPLVVTATRRGDHRSSKCLSPWDGRSRCRRRAR